MNGRDRMMVGLGATLAGAVVVGGVSLAVVAGAQPSSPPSTTESSSPSSSPSAQPPSLEDLEAKAAMISNPDQGTALQRSTGDPEARPVSGDGPQPTIYDPATVAAGDHTSMRFDVTRFEQEGATLWAIGNTYYGDVGAGEGRMPFIQDDGEWRIDRSWVCLLTKRPEGFSPQPGCENF